MIHLFCFVLRFPFFTRWIVNLDCNWTERKEIIIFLFTDIKKPCSILMTGTAKQQERNGRNAIFSSKDAPDSSWGLTQAFSSVQAQSRLWHIWVMCVTLGPLDLAPNQPVRHTQRHHSHQRERVAVSPDIHKININCIMCWASIWPFLSVSYRDNPSKCIYICLL